MPQEARATCGRGIVRPALVQTVRYSNVLDSIGRTPLVELKHCSPMPEVRLFAKLEGFNPSGSVKDRIAFAMVQEAERQGRLPPGHPIIDASSGNTGIALAMVGRALGHPVRIVMPENVPPEIPQLVASFGGELTWVPAEQGIAGAIELAKHLAARDGLSMLDQFSSDANLRAHYEGTGPEILAELPQVDAFVAGFGTAGTLMGVGRRLKEANPHTLVVAVEPHPGAQVQGLRSIEEGFVPPLLNFSALDGKILVRGEAAFAATASILQREAIFAGVSSGAVLHGAMKVAARLRKGNMVLLFADSGWKYLSSNLWSRNPHQFTDDLDDVVWW
jgi:[CysO sulfur-carrier protein]-thiocarboxylate-dependent cysteine synthase